VTLAYLHEGKSVTLGIEVSLFSFDSAKLASCFAAVFRFQVP